MEIIWEIDHPEYIIIIIRLRECEISLHTRDKAEKQYLMAVMFRPWGSIHWKQTQFCREDHANGSAALFSIYSLLLHKRVKTLSSKESSYKRSRHKVDWGNVENPCLSSSKSKFEFYLEIMDGTWSQLSRTMIICLFISTLLKP